MVPIVFILALFVVSKALVSFDEETLIILATILWVDAAGGLFKSFLDSELAHKVDSVESKFVWFLGLKKQLLADVLHFHTTRLGLPSVLISFNNSFISLLLLKTVGSYLDSASIKRVYREEEHLSSFGNAAQYDKIVRGLQETLTALDFGSTSVRISTASGKKSIFSGYFTSNYLKG